MREKTIVISFNLIYRFGGWIVDGFPTLRDHWSIMTDKNILPDFVLSLETDEKDDLCLKRFCDLKGLPYPKEETTNEATETNGEETQQKKVSVA